MVVSWVPHGWENFKGHFCTQQTLWGHLRGHFLGCEPVFNPITVPCVVGWRKCQMWQKELLGSLLREDTFKIPLARPLSWSWTLINTGCSPMCSSGESVRCDNTGGRWRWQVVCRCTVQPNRSQGVQASAYYYMCFAGICCRYRWKRTLKRSSTCQLKSTPRVHRVYKRA